jgi:Flp pilus assembly protein TadD
MRRLYTSRSDAGEAQALEGFDADRLEGDPLFTSRDEGPSLRPYAADLPGRVSDDLHRPTRSEDDQALRRANELESLGRRLDAVLVLTQALIERPGVVNVRLRLAHLLATHAETDEALEILTAGLEADPKPAPLLVARGALLGSLNRHREAEHDLRLALTTAPEDHTAHLQLGLALIRRGLVHEGLPSLQRAERFGPEDPDVAFHLGEAYYHAGDLETARAQLHRATELRPNDARPYKLLGRLLDRLGRTDEAMAMHRRARDASAR